jgi:hypothetical protein
MYDDIYGLDSWYEEHEEDYEYLEYLEDVKSGKVLDLTEMGGEEWN